MINDRMKETRKKFGPLLKRKKRIAPKIKMANAPVSSRLKDNRVKANRITQGMVLGLFFTIDRMLLPSAPEISEKEKVISPIIRRPYLETCFNNLAA